MTDEYNILDEILQTQGPDTAESYLALAKATRGMVAIWMGFIQAPVDSLKEAQYRTAMERMLEGLERNPDKSVMMIQSLLSIIYQMRNGYTYESWFEEMGISPTGEDDVT